MVDASPLADSRQQPQSVDGVARYECPVPDFNLDRLEPHLAESGTIPLTPGRPRILLVTDGDLAVVESPDQSSSHKVPPGKALWLSASAPHQTLVGTGTAYLAYPD